MSGLRRFAWTLWLALLPAAQAVASEPAFPAKPIRILAAEPGGGSDFAARLIAQGMAGSFNEPVIVENKAGASGVIAAETVASTAPDGYTMLFYGNGFWLLPFLQSKVSYDPIKDFAPVTLTVTTPLILTVNPAAGAKSVPDLIAIAKAKPGQLNYASGGAGTIPHLAAELFNAMAGVRITRVPYKSTGPALNALMGNEVQVMFGNASSVMPQVKSNRLLALAVTSAQPSALLPGLPSLASLGLPGYSAETMYGMFAPAKTPKALIARLNEAIVRTLNAPAVKDKFFASGAEVVASSPERLGELVKADMARLGKVIKDSGIVGE
jgi:tripartite-type tricarboxylate transporter receptor subunit TctC